MSYDAWTAIGAALIAMAMFWFGIFVERFHPNEPPAVGRPLNDFGQACQAVEELATKLSATVDRMNAILDKAEGMLK